MSLTKVFKCFCLYRRRQYSWATRQTVGSNLEGAPNMVHLCPRIWHSMVVLKQKFIFMVTELWRTQCKKSFLFKRSHTRKNGYFVMKGCASLRLYKFQNSQLIGLEKSQPSNLALNYLNQSNTESKL